MEADDLPFRGDIRPVVQVKSSAHALMGFVNDAFAGNLGQLCNSLVYPKANTTNYEALTIVTTICAGSARGSKKDKGFMFEKPIDLKIGVNHLALLSSSMRMKVISDCFGS